MLLLSFVQPELLRVAIRSVFSRFEVIESASDGLCTYIINSLSDMKKGKQATALSTIYLFHIPFHFLLSPGLFLRARPQTILLSR